MDAIFHEKQEGALCAQHCLNALLQDLASIAESLDDEERERMAEGNPSSEEFQKFLQQPSSNMDDSGFFSIQVICKALSVWGLELIPYSHPDSQDARENPQNQKAYICNLQQHWFTIRKLGYQWFNINSIKTEPELISETYLSLYLTQLQAEGYSIFVVKGDIISCEADQLLKLFPAKPKKQTPKPSKSGQSLIQKSDLQSALNQLQGSGGKPVDIDEVRKRREKYFAKLQVDQEAGTSTSRDKSETSQDTSQSTQPTKGETPSTTTDEPMSEMTEDEMLQAALLMSLDSTNTT
ncbi:ataxin-3-like isoform X2 [Actinia tenebrosa]|uniref:Ataxin-3 homolog n=1 Tax=Actinia tenebrosa TaxID=6105 RepID=A0A6P8I4Y2_ACTTE|nr:ataxin-3-like isoform X2 [Actinia tenebrosa]